MGAAGLLVVGVNWMLRTPRVHASAETEEFDSTPVLVRVETIRPRKGDMDRTSRQPGSIQAYESVRLYPGVPGYLQNLSVDIGDRVEKGQVLATLSVPELEKQVERHAAMVEQTVARVRQARAKLTTARAELEAAKAAITQAEATLRTRSAELRFRKQQLKRMQELFALKSIDERLVDEKTEQRDAAVEAEHAARAAIATTKAQAAAAEAKVVQAEADIVESEAEVRVARAEHERAGVLVGFATIRAPFKGVVTQRAAFPGDYIRAANDSHQPLLTVQRTDRMRVIVQIPDRDVPYADPGDQAVVEVDALPGQKFPAKVSRIAQSEDAGTRLMRLEIDLPNPTRKICNGMYGHVTLVLEKSELLGIPSGCLVGKAQDGQGSAYVVRDGKAHRVSLRIGADDGRRVAVLSGLNADDEVVLRPSSEIADGMNVIASPETTASSAGH